MSSLKTLLASWGLCHLINPGGKCPIPSPPPDLLARTLRRTQYKSARVLVQSTGRYFKQGTQQPNEKVGLERVCIKLSQHFQLKSEDHDHIYCRHSTLNFLFHANRLYYNATDWVASKYATVTGDVVSTE